MLETALLILSIGTGDTVQMSLARTDSPAACLERADALAEVLTSAGYTIAGMRCGESPLALTPYEHGHDEGDLRWHYHVTLKGSDTGDGFTFEPVAEGTCEAVATNEFCAVSAQQPTGE
ncbi:hypothetical protein [Pontibaca methylaminivorans]|uniref:Uncharacterized protein n=1 Tax=Pontibaca methylaminivorans TaxID=515897 RepID=A0A1R3WNZ7_9RHOB|nr:hypothetical protein [Pontibaca methylaminivorans]SIT79605.1 hypothetical protein SAMN05421849_1170 [Pontibaca methylaminivorans]